VRGQKLIVGLICASITPVIGEHDDRPWSHLLTATRPSFALKERRCGLRRLVLENGANIWIVESDLERRRRDDDFGPRVDSRILGTRAADPNARP
jgi:hypothetical protein